jgi:predicted kinase
MEPRRLIVIAGLPGSGKSSVAEGLARALGVPILSVGPIEAAMWRGGIPKSMTRPAAHEVAEALAEDTLRLGLAVIADAVDPLRRPGRCGAA